MLTVLLCFLLQNSIASSRRKSSGLSCELTQRKSGLSDILVKIQCIGNPLLAFHSYSKFDVSQAFSQTNQMQRWPRGMWPQRFFPQFSTRQVWSWKCQSVISNHGSVLAKREWQDKCLASSGQLVPLKKEDFQMCPHLLASPWSYPVSRFEGRKKKMESVILSGPSPEETSEKLPGAVRSWAGTWFGDQQLPHPCRGKGMSKPNPGRSPLQMSQELLSPSVSI